MAPRISVVVPTYNRCDLLKHCLAGLERQTLPVDGFEVIVVIDGSADGTAAFARTYSPRYAFRVLEQGNRGQSAACNLGGRSACADLILFLDDDLIPDPDLLAEHLRGHGASPDIVAQGRLAIHASVERTPYIRYKERLRARFHEAKTGGAPRVDPEEVSGGNLSLPRSAFEKVGGFNEQLRRNTDGDLAQRLDRAGFPIHYVPKALAYLGHVKDLDAALEAARAYGRSYAIVRRERPDTIWALSPMVHDGRSLLRNTARRLYFRTGTQWRLGWLEKTARIAIRASELLGLAPVSAALYRLTEDLHFWKGVHAESAGEIEGFRPKGIPVLCYHNVSDRKNERFRNYLLPVAVFGRQMAWLKRNGYQAISLDALCDYLTEGQALPPKPVAITFDDGYQELGGTATPLLAELGFCHTHFVNTGKLGGATDWIEHAGDFPILSADDIRSLLGQYGDTVAFQAHGKTHAALRGDAPRVREEVNHSLNTLPSITGRPVRFLAYPYGEYDDGTVETVRELPVRCSFTIDQGLCRPGQDLNRLPRVEVFTQDFSIDFYLKVRYGTSFIANARRKLKRKYRKFMRLIGRKPG